MPQTGVQFLNCSALEAVQNGVIFNPGCDFQCKTFKIPHVIVFTNEEPAQEGDKQRNDHLKWRSLGTLYDQSLILRLPEPPVLLTHHLVLVPLNVLFLTQALLHLVPTRLVLSLRAVEKNSVTNPRDILQTFHSA